jgi:hypothetical protein
VVKVTAKEDQGATVTVCGAQLDQRASTVTAAELAGATPSTCTIGRASYLPTVYDDAASDVDLDTAWRCATPSPASAPVR